MTRSRNSRKGRSSASPSRSKCSCGDPDCGVQVSKGKHRKKDRREQKKYYCRKCKSNHYYNSEIGMLHMR